MRAVVFGGSGFLGSHLIDYLLEKEHKVLCFDAKDNPYIDNNTANYDYYHIPLIIANKPALEYKLNKFRPDIAYNFLGTADMDKCEDFPSDCIYNNIITNTIILDALKSISSNCFYVYASSIYAGVQDTGFYGISKKTCEEYIRQWFKNKDSNNYLILRYGTIYGPRATKENSIRSIIEKAIRDRIISHYGNGTESREYIHVKDAARYTYDLSINNMIAYYGKIIKLTGPYPVTAQELVFMIKEILDNEYGIEFRNENRQGHYVKTPYRYSKKVVLMYVGKDYIDLGKGLLEVINEYMDKLG